MDAKDFWYKTGVLQDMLFLIFAPQLYKQKHPDPSEDEPDFATDADSFKKMMDEVKARAKQKDDEGWV